MSAIYPLYNTRTQRTIGCQYRISMFLQKRDIEKTFLTLQIRFVNICHAFPDCVYCDTVCLFANDLDILFDFVYILLDYTMYE